MKMSRIRKNKQQQGQGLVEFTLVSILLVLLLFGIIQYGFIFAAYITVRNASAVGVRQLVIDKTAVSTAQTVAKNSVAPMLTPSRATATATTTNVSGTTAQMMTVSYNLPLIFGFVVPGTNNTFTLTATTVLR